MNPLEMIVLSVIGEAPAYGYAITKKIEARSENSIKAGPSVLYPLLKRLEKQGYVSPNWETVRSERTDDDSDGRRRKWYRLTPKGQRRLEQAIRSHRAHTAMLDEFINAGPGAAIEETSP